MNYEDVFNNYEDRGWNDITKLDLIIQFLEQNVNEVVSPEMFNNFLLEVIGVEEEV